MEQIQVPRYALRSYSQVMDYRSALREKLADFCMAQLRKLKLVTSTFTHRFYLHEHFRFQARGFGKLCKILERAMLKRNPALIYALRPGDSKPLLSVDGDGVSLTVMTNSCDDTSLRRYLRFLEYTLRKKGIPMQVTGSVSSEGVLSVMVRPRVWWPATRAADEPYDAWVARVQRGFVSRGRSPDAIFAATGHWESVDVCHLSVAPADASHIAIMERIFVVLPEVMQVVQTLSRKFAYASSAFAVEPAASA